VDRRVIGILVPSVEVAQQVGFLIIFPLTFISNAFVPTSTLPSWLQPFAEWNPFSALISATRELFGNPNPVTPGFPGEHAVLLSLLWTIGLIAVFAARNAAVPARSIVETPEVANA
jgi:ABC-type multidrug transport system permease subunit